MTIPYRCDRTEQETEVDGRDLTLVPHPAGWMIAWHCGACHDVHAEPLNELLLGTLEERGFSVFEALCGVPA